MTKTELQKQSEHLTEMKRRLAKKMVSHGAAWAWDNEQLKQRAAKLEERERRLEESWARLRQCEEAFEAEVWAHAELVAAPTSRNV